VRNPELLEQTRNIARLAEKFSNIEMEMEALHLVLRMKPSDTVAHLRLASCYRNKGEMEKSAEHLLLAKEFGAPL
jgi:transcriptional regulator NrdR family protein